MHAARDRRGLAGRHLFVAFAAAALVAVAAGPASAEDARGMVAHFAPTDAKNVVAATGFRLEGVRGYTNLVVGSFRAGAYEQRTLVLLRCNERECRGQAVYLGAHPIKLRGLVDLGKPGPLEGGPEVQARTDWDKALSGRRMRWPALVVEIIDERAASETSPFGHHYEGSERHHELVLVSLRRADAASPKIARLPTMDRYPSGAGTTATYRLARGHGRGPLEIIGAEQRHLDNDSACLEPEPVDVRWVLRKGRYQRVELDGLHGCH